MSTYDKHTLVFVHFLYLPLLFLNSEGHYFHNHIALAITHGDKQVTNRVANEILRDIAANGEIGAI